MSRLRPVARARPGPCDPGSRRPDLSIKKILLAFTGLVLLVCGVLIAPETLPIGPVLISAGGVLVLVGLALPLMTDLEIGLPSIFKVTIAATARHDRVRSSIDDSKGLLVACADCLCSSQESAIRALEASVSEGLSRWHGRDLEELRSYLLCTLVQQSRFEARTYGTLSPPSPNAFFALSLREREVLILLDRAMVNEADTARMLRLSIDDVGRIRSEALAHLAIVSDER